MRARAQMYNQYMSKTMSGWVQFLLDMASYTMYSYIGLSLLMVQQSLKLVDLVHKQEDNWKTKRSYTEFNNIEARHVA